MRIVRNMKGRTGKPVANQFIIYGVDDDGVQTETFQSYDSLIARVSIVEAPDDLIELDRKYWDYSRTTSKYLGQFLGLPMAEIRKAVKAGEFQLVDLN